MLKGGTRLASSKGEEDRDAEEGEGVRQRGEETEKGHHKSANQNDPTGPGNGQTNHKANRLDIFNIDFFTPERLKFQSISSRICIFMIRK